MRNRSAILALLLAASALAQPPQGKSAGISGVVLNSVTNVPLARVHVTLTSEEKEPQTYGALTTAEGKFAITGMPAGPYSITLERVGFTMPTDEHTPENNPLLLLPDAAKDDLKLKLVPAGAITGRVTNAEGEPVQAAEVIADNVAGVSGVDSFHATTDSKGAFRLGGLPPGKYRLKAVPENNHAPAELRTDGTHDVQDGPASYDSRVTVTPAGEVSGVAIRLGRVPIVAVSGKIEGAPAGAFNPQLFLTEAGGGGRSSGGVKPNGTFRLWRLYPGKYEVSASWQAPGGRDVRTAAVPFEVAGSNIDHFVLRVIPPSDLSGHIDFQDDGAKPAPGAVSQLVLVTLGMQMSGKSVPVGPDGSFRISQLPAGRYRVIPSWKNSYVASMALGTAQIDGSLLDLSNSSAGSDLSVRLRAANGRITGRIAADKTPVRVMLISDEEDGGIRPRSTGATPDGTYAFDAVAPGKYKLVAVPDADGLYGRLQGYERQMESIEVHSGETLTRDLKRQDADQ